MKFTVLLARVSAIVGGSNFIVQPSRSAPKTLPLPFRCSCVLHWRGFSERDLPEGKLPLNPYSCQQRSEFRLP